MCKTIFILLMLSVGCNFLQLLQYISKNKSDEQLSEFVQRNPKRFVELLTLLNKKRD